MGFKKLTIMAVLATCLLFFTVGNVLAADSISSVKKGGSGTGEENVKVGGKTVTENKEETEDEEEEEEEEDATNTKSDSKIKFSISKFISDDFWGDVNSLLPLARLVSSFVIFVLLVSYFLTPSVGAIKTNAGAAMSNNEVRKDGHKTTFHSILGLFLLILGLMTLALLLNDYGPWNGV